MSAAILSSDVSKQRFSNFFEEAPFPAALFSGPDLRIDMANPLSLQFWGKDTSIIGKPLLEAIPELKDQQLYYALKEVYRTGRTYEGQEDIVQSADPQDNRYVNRVYKAIKDANGNVTGVFAVGHDVTSQVIARKKLQQSETRARVAIESAGLGTFEVNYESDRTATSPRFDEIFGFDRPASHKEYLTRIHPDDAGTRNAAHEKALETGTLSYEARLLLPGRSMRWVRINASVIHDENQTPHLLIGTAQDITEEKLSFQKLQESEERFRTLITETPEVGVGLYFGSKHRIQYVNEVMLRFWGKDSSVVGKSWKEALPELEGQPFFRELDGVFTTGESFTGKEVRAELDRNGTRDLRYYNYTYKALKNSAGEVIAIHHMAVDVTEQVTSKLKLIESEAAVRRLFEQTPVGLAMFKGESLIVEMVNETLLSYWDRKREDVISKPVFDILPEVAEQGIEQIAREVYKTGRPYSSPETPVSLSRNGRTETIIVRFGFQAMRDWQEEIVGLLAIANDVTDLVTARQKVEKNEMRLKFLADSMPQVVWMADGDGTVTYYNNRVLAFAGIRQSEDGTWVWKSIVHPDDAESTNRTWHEAVRTRKPYEIEHRIMMKDGSFRWHLSRAYAYETDEGIKWYGTATDVHDQKILEMNLEELVRERTLELQRSNDDLQQFAHVASHDLKEPVRKIKTFTYKLQDEYKHVLGDRGNLFVNKILHAGDRMSAMISGVLNYASMPASSHTTEAIDLNNVVDTVKSDLEVLIAETQATITCGGLPTIVGVKDLIHQLFYNLINNSLKFTREDVPPLVSLSCSQTTVAEKRYHEIVVTDNGIGFEQLYAEDIFTSFIRLNSKDRYEGSGLGLALCKKIVERHGGMISATSEKGKGAQFHILLPAST